MGHGPKITAAIRDKSVDQQALQAEIDRVRATMDNSEAKALAYVNANTDGVVLGKESGKPETFFSNNQSYTRYSEEYSLKALDGVIDGVIDSAKNGMKVAASEGSDPEAVLNLVGSIGGLIKAGLALASSSSTTTTDIDVTFSQFNVGKKNYAVYNGVNSGIVKASNAWGNKDITLIAQTTVLYRVKTDENLTNEAILQGDLDHLEKLKDIFNKMSEDALENGTDNISDLLLAQGLIRRARDAIQVDRQALNEANAVMAAS